MGQLDMAKAQEVLGALQRDLIMVRLKSALLKSSNPEKEAKFRRIENLLEEAQGIAEEMRPEEAGA